MNEQNWDRRMIDFLRKTGESLKTETQRLVTEVKDPVTQEKVKGALREFGTWAKKAAEDAAVIVEHTLRKAEQAWKRPADGIPRADPQGDAPSDADPSQGGRGSTAKYGTPNPSYSSPAGVPNVSAPETDGDDEEATGPRRAAPRKAGKSVGRKAGGPGTDVKKSSPAAKTLGKKKR